MSKYSAQQRDEILRQSSETLERLKDFKVRAPDPEREMWQLPPEEPAPRRRQPEHKTDAERSREWSAFVESKIDAALAQRRDFDRDVLAGVIASIRKMYREEIEKAVEQLRTEFQAEAGLIRADVEIVRRHSNVIDLPTIPLRRQAS